MLWRFRSDLLFRIPHVFWVVGAHAGVVRTRLVNDRNLELLGIRLGRASDRDVHTILFAIPIGVEFRFDP